ncbi:MAG: hypothetical protein LBK83_14210 [Treponema sp.]|jgi:hypothetical protein|nr:hypothetical protein [Treponema sp.]
MKKRRILNVFIIALFWVVLTGCTEVKTLPPLDDNAAVEDCAVFVIPNEAKIKRIDGAKRGLFSSWGSGLSGAKAATLLMPAGEHTIIFEYSNSADGWTAKKLECTVEMNAGQMYIVSAALDKNTENGKFRTIINEAASFVRDDVVELVPFIDFLPRPNPKGIVYQISEIDQTAFDQYLHEKVAVEKKSA